MYRGMQRIPVQRLLLCVGGARGSNATLPVIVQAVYGTTVPHQPPKQASNCYAVVRFFHAVTIRRNRVSYMLVLYEAPVLRPQELQRLVNVFGWQFLACFHVPVKSKVAVQNQISSTIKCALVVGAGLKFYKISLTSQQVVEL